MITRYCILFVVISLISCNEEKQEIIDLSEIMPGSEWENEDQAVQLDTLDALVSIKDRFEDHGISVLSLSIDESSYFPDRFGPETTEKYILITQSDTLRYLKWNYSDSMKVMNSFFNWINCYGDDCKSIFIGEERNFQKDPMQLYVTDTSLIFITARHDLDFNAWLNYENSLGHSSEWNYLIEQRRRARAKWFTFVDRIKTEYKNENSQ